MPNQPKTTARTVRIDDELWAATNARAKRDGLKASDVVRQALRRFLAGLAVLLLLGGCGQVDARAEATATANQAALDSQAVSRDLTAAPFIAHRGGRGLYPEASMVAYRAAAMAGFPLEGDVRALSDGTLVLMHDGTVDRTTNGSGPVSSFTAASWARLRIDRAGGAPPTWAQFLDAFGDGQHLLVPEVKDPAATDAFIASVKGRGLEGSVLAQSFNPDVAGRLAEAGIPTLLLVVKAADVQAMPGVGWYGCPTGAEQTGCVAAAQALGAKVAVWTVNDPATARALTRQGVAVFTDTPWRESGKRVQVRRYKSGPWVGFSRSRTGSR